MIIQEDTAGSGFETAFLLTQKTWEKCGLLSFGRKPTFPSEKTEKLAKVLAGLFPTNEYLNN
jgi:hypothetical protein